MNSLRIATIYTLLQFALGVGAGFILGILKRVVGLNHQWGALDATAAIQLVTTAAIALGVFAAFAKRHPDRYYATGGIIVLLSAVLDVASAYLVAPQSARETYAWGIAVIDPLALNVAAFVILGLFLRMRQSSSNTSLERTRER